MSFPRSALAGLHPYAPDPTPVDVDLSDNTNLWGPHPAALATLAGAAAGVARYPTAYGDPVRHAVARRFGVDVTCVTTGCGSDDLIDAAFRAFAEPGEALVLQGRPIAEPTVQHGPFVMNTRAEINQAIMDYRRTQFGGWPWRRDDPVHPREEGRFAVHADGRTQRPA